MFLGLSHHALHRIAHVAIDAGWKRTTVFAVVFSLLSCVELLGQDAPPTRAQAVVSVVRDLRSIITAAARAEPAEQSLLVAQALGVTDTLNAKTMETRVFAVGGVTVEPDARAILDAVNARVNGALQSFAGTPTSSFQPNAAQILNAYLFFTTEVVWSGGERAVVTSQGVNSVLTGLCPLYPIC